MPTGGRVCRALRLYAVRDVRAPVPTTVRPAVQARTEGRATYACRQSNGDALSSSVVGEDDGARSESDCSAMSFMYVCVCGRAAVCCRSVPGLRARLAGGRSGRICVNEE